MPWVHDFSSLANYRKYARLIVKKHTSLCTGFQRASFPDSPYKALLTQAGSSTAFYLTGSIVHLFIYYSQGLLLRAFEFSSFLSLLKCWPIVPAGHENTRIWSNCSEGRWQGGLAWCVRVFAAGGFLLWAKCWHARLTLIIHPHLTRCLWLSSHSEQFCLQSCCVSSNHN